MATRAQISTQTSTQASTQTRTQDFILVIGALILLLGQSYILALEMRWLKADFYDRDEGAVSANRQIGWIEERQNQLRRRGLTSLSWFGAATGDKVYRDDTLMTGANSSARVRLLGRGDLWIEPQSLVRFSESDGKNSEEPVELELRQGRARLKNSQKKMKLAMGGRTLILHPDSEVELKTSSMGSKKSVKVRSGKAEILPVKSEAAERTPLATSSSTNQVIDSGTEAVLSDGVEVAQIARELSMQSIHPESGAVVFAKGVEAEVSFGWAIPEAEPKADIVEWSENSDFQRTDSLKTKGNGALRKFPPGKYYWRARSGASVSQIQSFTVAPQVKYVALSPKLGANVSQASDVLLRWQTIPDADGFRLQVSTTQDFSRIVKETHTDKPRFVLNSLKAGTYYWRIEPHNQEWGSWPQSPVFHFRVKQSLNAPKLKRGRQLQSPSKPKEKTRSLGPSEIWKAILDTVWIRQAHAAEPEAKLLFEFEWEPSPGALQYRLQVSLDQGFTRLVHDGELPTTMCELLLPDASTYYWRVAAIDADGDSSIFSEPQSVQKETAKPVAKRAISSEAQSSPVIAPPNPVSINQIRFGMGTGYSFEKYSSANLGVKANGFVPLRFHSLIQFDYFRLWDLRLLLQKIQYRSQDAAILDFNSPSDVTTGKVELLGRGVFNFKKVPLNLGWAVYVHPYVQRLAPETIQFKTAISTGPVVGTSWSWGTIFGATLQSDAMLQAELLGRIQGVGLVHRGSAEWRKLSRTWIPRVEWFTNPYYRSTPSGISLFGFESGVFFQAAILLGGERNSRLESGALR